MTKIPMLKLAVALTLVSAAVSPSHAQDAGALVDKLVKKGVLTDQEAEEVRADMMRDFSTQTNAGKINLSSSITELKLYGDFRYGTSTTTARRRSLRQTMWISARAIVTGCAWVPT